jgi:hypothetical protein
MNDASSVLNASNYRMISCSDAASMRQQTLFKRVPSDAVLFFRGYRQAQ